MVEFKYKCRLCGDIHSYCDIENDYAFPVLIHAIAQVKMPDHLQGYDIPMIAYHSCNDHNVGVSDFIGYIEV